jgi:hypothetical protein
MNRKTGGFLVFGLAFWGAAGEALPGGQQTALDILHPYVVERHRPATGTDAGKNLTGRHRDRNGRRCASTVATVLAKALAPKPAGIRNELAAGTKARWHRKFLVLRDAA